MADRVTPVEPTGTRTVTGFWDGHDPMTGKFTGGFGSREVPAYPDSPRGKALGQLRRELHLGLSTCARLAGVTPEQFSGLEHGRYTFADDGEWERVSEALRKGVVNG